VAHDGGARVRGQPEVHPGPLGAYRRRPPALRKGRAVGRAACLQRPRHAAERDEGAPRPVLLPRPFDSGSGDEISRPRPALSRRLPEQSRPGGVAYALDARQARRPRRAGAPGAPGRAGRLRHRPHRDELRAGHRSARGGGGSGRAPLRGHERPQQSPAFHRGACRGDCGADPAPAGAGPAAQRG